jgi:hypothetical protein
LISRNEIKRSHSGLVNMTHQKAALYGTTHKVIGEKSAACQGVARRAKPEGHISQMPALIGRTW